MIGKNVKEKKRNDLTPVTGPSPCERPSPANIGCKMRIRSGSPATPTLLPHQFSFLLNFSASCAAVSTSESTSVGKRSELAQEKVRSRSRRISVSSLVLDLIVPSFFFFFFSLVPHDVTHMLALLLIFSMFHRIS